MPGTEPDSLRLDPIFEEIEAIVTRLYPGTETRDTPFTDDQQFAVITAFFAGHAGPFRFYPNPVRNDGTGWVGQDRYADPEAHHRNMGAYTQYFPDPAEAVKRGKPIIPPVPYSARAFPFGIEPALAQRILAALNKAQ